MNLRMIPKTYPIQIKNSKNRLFPFAVLDVQDFRMEIGQESPKQSIISASNKSVIFLLLFPPSAAALAGCSVPFCQCTRQSDAAVLFLLLQISGASVLIQIVALAVNDDKKRHFLHIELAQRFRPKVLVSDQLGFFDAFCQQCSGAADGSEVDAAIFFIASTTSGRRAPFPIMPRAPTDIMVGA